MSNDIRKMMNLVEAFGLGGLDRGFAGIDGEKNWVDLSDKEFDKKLKKWLKNWDKNLNIDNDYYKLRNNADKGSEFEKEITKFWKLLFETAKQLNKIEKAKRTK